MPGQQGGMPDIADIKGLVLPEPGIPWLWVAAGVMGVLVLAAGIVLFMRYRRRRSACPAAPDCFAELSALRRSPGVPLEDVYAQLSGLVRERLAQNFLMSAGTMNRAEITAAVVGRAVPAGARSALDEFLENAEAVLFAGVLPDSEGAERDMDRVELFLRETETAGQGDGFAYAENGEDGA